MVELHDERDLVRILARDRSQNAERRTTAFASAFDGELDDIFSIKIDGVGRKARTRPNVRCLDPQAKWRDSPYRQAAVVQKRLQTSDTGVGRSESV